jgi:hypothetical protein
LYGILRFQRGARQEIRANHLQRIASRFVATEHRRSDFKRPLDHGQLALVQLEIDDLELGSIATCDLYQLARLRPAHSAKLLLRHPRKVLVDREQNKLFGEIRGIASRGIHRMSSNFRAANIAWLAPRREILPKFDESLIALMILRLLPSQNLIDLSKNDKGPPAVEFGRHDGPSVNP